LIIRLVAYGLNYTSYKQILLMKRQLLFSKITCSEFNENIVETDANGYC